MKKTILLTTLVLVNFLILASVFAEAKTKENPVFEVEFKKVNRKEALTKFFKRYDSPLEKNVDTFIEEADKYGIDYRIIPSISCMESTCGKSLIKDSYNPFGWGIYGSNAMYFNDYNEAIKTVADGLNKGYFSKGYNTVEKIAPIYTPPNSYNWERGVSFFMNEISSFE
jgi:hypothetical protein